MTTKPIDLDFFVYLCMLIYIIRCKETIQLQEMFDTKNKIKGGNLWRI